jgi:hypothetical protein
MEFVTIFRLNIYQILKVCILSFPFAHSTPENVVTERFRQMVSDHCHVTYLKLCCLRFDQGYDVRVDMLVLGCLTSGTCQ